MTDEGTFDQNQVRPCFPTKEDKGRLMYRVNRPGMSGDFEPWEGWSHVREHV